MNVKAALAVISTMVALVIFIVVCILHKAVYTILMVLLFSGSVCYIIKGIFEILYDYFEDTFK